ncbi:MAG TPA: acyl-CoA dehydrogenase N-terminal domain-containing protein, partial [bacterium]|nr:acyl-CoA dehydrogenase N-terminal domain-containing protein [bacterium]
MPDYRVDIRDIRFCLNEYLDLNDLCSLPVFQERGFDPEMLLDMVEQARKLSIEKVAPMNETSDQEGAKYNKETSEVTTPDCFKEAY